MLLLFSEEAYTIFFWDEHSKSAKETTCYSHSPGVHILKHKLPKLAAKMSVKTPATAAVLALNEALSPTRWQHQSQV
jgi:hypothetical protein